jgi:hypothetical protein
MPQVKVHGRTENIPDMWLAGFCTANKLTVQSAVEWWLWQSEMEQTGLWVEPPQSLRVFA